LPEGHGPEGETASSLLAVSIFGTDSSTATAKDFLLVLIAIILSAPNLMHNARDSAALLSRTLFTTRFHSGFVQLISQKAISELNPSK
jgi:hypothetical protein